VSGNLSTLRSQSSLAGAQITTYTYDPLVGMKSQTDANNFTSYFFYDKLGRLDYITDKDANILQTYQYKYKNN
jgi:YD repeat-containing protein